MEFLEWQEVTKNQPKAKTPVLLKGSKGYPFVGLRCQDKDGNLLPEFYVPVSYGKRGQYTEKLKYGCLSLTKVYPK